MKKVLLLAGVTFLIILISGLAGAASVVNSKHDFSLNNTDPSAPFARNFQVAGQPLPIDEVCVFCHTPHGASTDAARGTNKVLWNRTAPVGAGPANTNYTLYSSPSMTTAIVIERPTGVTLMCLSCHDGVSSIAVGDPASNTQTLLNTPGTGNAAVSVLFGNADKIGQIYFGDPLNGGWRANIGNINPATNPNAPIDLSNDHPVAFNWVDGITGIKRPANAEMLRRLLTNMRLECSTCHNVHDNAIPPFLVMSNSSSAMCLDCHIK